MIRAIYRLPQEFGLDQLQLLYQVVWFKFNLANGLDRIVHKIHDIVKSLQKCTCMIQNLNFWLGKWMNGYHLVV